MYVCGFEDEFNLSDHLSLAPKRDLYRENTVTLYKKEGKGQTQQSALQDINFAYDALVVMPTVHL